MFLNVVVGSPLIAPEQLLAADSNDWLENEKFKHYLLKQDIFQLFLKKLALFHPAAK